MDYKMKQGPPEGDKEREELMRKKVRDFKRKQWWWDRCLLAVRIYFIEPRGRYNDLYPRLNRLNPLTYIYIIVVIVPIAAILGAIEGVKGFWED